MSFIDIHKNSTYKYVFNSNFSWFHVGLIAVTMFSLALLTIVGNTIVIYALRTNRNLRTVRF